jgi:hypothetical protein
MKISKLFEDLSNKLQGKADDHEVDMAITDLRAIADMAGKLAEHLSQENPAELEGWVQAKITKAADYIDAVYKNHVYSDHDCGCGSATRGNALSEEKGTCCGKCGHVHVKGTSCPKPFLTGARHCRNRK